jgi:DNA polymerase III sliding clamp (beta) subunit (PCNA family)
LNCTGCRIDADGASGEFPDIILPRETVLTLQHLFGKTSEPLSFEFSQSKCKIFDSATTFVSKFIAGTFPDYESAIPDNRTVLKADARNLRDALDRVGTFVGEGRGLKLALADNGASISTIGRANELGVANEELEVEFDGELNIGVNPRFLLAVLAHLDNEKAEIRLSDPGSAILFTDTDALFAVMPMRA